MSATTDNDGHGGKAGQLDCRRMVDAIRQHPEYDRVGMLLLHNGVVRGTSRDGRKVTGLKVQVDHTALNEIVRSGKQQPGIVEILVEINENIPLQVGDDVMLLAVAGDVRENVTAVLTDTLNRIKTQATGKTEFFVD